MPGSDLVLDAVDHRHQHRRPGQVAVAARIRAAELEALGLRALRVHRNADGGRPVARRERQIDRRLEPGHQAAVRVRGRRGERENRGGVLEQAARGPEAELAQPGVAVAGEQRLAALPQRRVRVHAAAVVLEDRLRHERHRLAVALRDVLADVLVPHELIGHLDQRLELHVDFALAGRGDLVMVRLDDDPDLAHLVDHLAAQVVVGVGRADGKVASLEARLVAKVRLLDARRVPRAFDRVDLVVAAVLVLLVANLVEDEELRLGPDEAGVGDARLLQVLLGFARDMARVPREFLPGDRIDDVGDHAHRRLRKERIKACGGGVRDGHHVGLVDAHPAANRRAVEPEALLEGAFIQHVRSGNEQCCQLPSMSTNFRSTISAWFFLA